ncbi:translocation/assembly module TamB domain-containing protein [Pseudenhygromyxa sp. WMMC2535]|uniref:translocation/assembly module TamB domain-containing protein n=1 Tax=Pseudenhygromyxa sp. WMMC2535 TaxID=2712867 RepID=UPI001555A4C3|nr:translocation/assembly module TamB domain-containing protein [Pseudenhygromyxa sp. WMMC2535]NVB41671.1 translocation/assembly module TamB domain-containing protein [Pseudenhygromyxa sp. WMMC2535]
MSDSRKAQDGPATAAIHERWQAEADLLADGRERLEALCATTRYRHLFPGGANMALLFRAYQDLERWRMVRRHNREDAIIPWSERRYFARRLAALVREDALARDRRLLWRYPLPRPRPLKTSPPDLVREALTAVDSDAWGEVIAIVHGMPNKGAGASAGAPPSPPSRDQAEQPTQTDQPDPLDPLDQIDQIEADSRGGVAASGEVGTARTTDADAPKASASASSSQGASASSSQGASASSNQGASASSNQGASASTSRGASASTSRGASASGQRAARVHRGLQQFRDGLINAALQHPQQIGRLHPQYLQFMASPQPTRRRYPVANMLLVKLPLQLLMTLVLIFNLAYLGAYYFFNDERLGEFLSDKIGGLLDGDLEITYAHWTPMLIFDLLTGRPTHLEAREVSVWEPYKLDGGEKSRRTAYAEHVELSLILHEIIPWNRLGVPKLVEIPWFLHFTEVRNQGELWVEVRSYQNEHRDGAWMLSLINAFDPIDDLEAPENLKKLSYRIDHGDLHGLSLTLDLEERSGWATHIDFEDIEVALDFESWAPEDGRPDTLPLAYAVEASGGSGSFTIAPLHDGPMPIAALSELELASGMKYRPLGDVWIAGEAEFAGSPSVFSGRLLDAFGDIGFDFRLATTDVGPVAEVLFPPEPDDSGVMRAMIDGHGSPANLEVMGPVDEVVLDIVGQGLTLDLFPESAWAIDDVDVAISLAQDPLPDVWASLDHPANAAAEARARGEYPPPDPNDPDGAPLPDERPDERWIVYLDTFRGAALDGSVRLHRRGRQDHMVIAQEGEPLLISVFVDLLGVDLAKLTPDDPELGEMLAGQARGGVQVHQVVIGEDGPDHIEAELQRVIVNRDNGPEDDHLPSTINVDGEVIWDAVEGVDMRGLRVGVDGGQLRVSGGIDADFEQLEPSSASVRVDDGEAFLRAFGLPRWFDRLAVDFSLSGPLTNPRGSGSLDVVGAGSGALAVDDIQGASLRFDRGTLTLRSKQVEMLGGHGPLEAELGLLANGKALSDPRIRLALSLEDINRGDILGSGIGASDAKIELQIDDGLGGPVRMSQLQARGGAYADILSLAGVDYHDAEASFAFTRDGLQIDHLSLAYHRPVSPALRPKVSAPIGSVTATGTVGFDDDPALNLQVEATNVPLSGLASSFGEDLPIRGQVARGSRLAVTGSLRRPQVEGQLVLADLGAAGVPLGGGVLEFSSDDQPYVPGDPELERAATAAHRRVRVQGDLQAPSPEFSDEGDLDWHVDATVAFGGQSTDAIEAAVDLRFDTLPLDNLLTHPSREQWRTHVIGGLHGLKVEARYCPSHEDGQVPLLAECAELDPEDPRSLAGEPLRVDLSLAQLWYRGRREGAGSVTGVDPCLERDTTCSLSPLRAQLDGTKLSLAQPWQIQSGGKQGAVMQIDGTFDLSSTESPERAAAEVESENDEDGAGRSRARKSERDADSERRCIPGTPDNASLPPGETSATIVGGLDFAALSPLLSPYGFASPQGRLDIDLALTGVVARPTITGFVRLPEGEPLVLDLDDGATPEAGRRKRPIPIEVAKLDLQMSGGTVYLADANIEVFDESLRFGEIGNWPSYVDLAGPCSGRFALRGAGTIDGHILQRLLPGMLEGSGGAVELTRFQAVGDIAKLGASVDPSEGPPPALLDGLDATLSFQRKALRMTVSEFGELRLAGGTVEVHQCTAARPCGTPSGDDREGRRDRGVALWLGDRRTATSQSRPSEALTLRVGDRGRAYLWGELMIDDRFSELQNASMTGSADDFPLSLTDNSGRPELEAALSSDRISLDLEGSNGRISGKVLVDRSFWLRDARQGVAVLSFADPTPAPPSQLPEFVRDLELDLELETGAPFRVDNNVAKKLEASAKLQLAGTVGDPDLDGTITVERGVVDVDILGGAYDVQGGKVVLGDQIASSQLDLSATRQKAIKINNQLLTLNLRLSGTLDAIQWECSAPGDTSGALATTRGCVDYLIFDAGNTDLAKSDVRETRSNNSLLGTRFLPLAGRLTQVEVNEVLEREIPRAEAYIPIVRFRADQLGVLIEAETRPEWLRWGWGRLGLNLTYLRGYPGSVIRDSRSFSGILEILENTGIEATFGARNYSNRVLILDPPNYRSIQFIQRLEVPTPR